MDTPQSYARHLATYIASPTKIESLTRIEFGEAPPLHTIAEMRFAVERETKSFRQRSRHWSRDSQATDGNHYAVPSLIKVARPPRVRDYIHVAPLPIEEHHENPFLSLYRVGSRVIESVARDFGMTSADILGKRRHNELVDARAVVAMTLKRWGRKSYPEIGRIMGGRDHSTVIHAVQNFDIYCRRNVTVSASYERHLALIEEAERHLATLAQDNEREASVAA